MGWWWLDRHGICLPKRGMMEICHVMARWAAIAGTVSTNPRTLQPLLVTVAMQLAHGEGLSQDVGATNYRRHVRSELRERSR